MQGIHNINKNSTDLNILIERKMIYFDGGSTIGPLLQQAYKHLLTVKPTSVDSERAFSAAGQICTKIRLNLNDNSVGQLCLLKAHYIKN
jgi:hypothetical protein